MLRIFAVAVGFLVVAVVVERFGPTLFDVIDRMRVRYVLLVAAIAFALGLAAPAALVGSALIIDAFAAGVCLSGTNSQFDTIEHEVQPVASIFTPIFFVSVGASVNLSLLDPPATAAPVTLGVAATLTVLAVVGKFAAGWAAPWVAFRRLVVGVGMVPRGEVGLIFADIGRRAELIGNEVFGAVLLTVMATTFIAPPALKALFSGEKGATDP